MHPSSALATVLVDELVRCGVRDAVLCPGSRSAPLAYAFQEADRSGRVRLHVRIDERSAGFLALGLAKLSRAAVPVVTTSGTAVANLLPAVLEAHHGQVPLVVLSADRPPELRGTGANQTTDQVGIFGASVRWSADLGVPDHRGDQVATWRSSTCRAVHAALGASGGPCGPVQVNIPLRDPLVPDGDPSWVEPLAGRPDGSPWVVLDPPPAGPMELEPGPRTLVIAGDLADPLQYQRVAEIAAIGWPVVSEPFGRIDRSAILPHGPALLAATEWLELHLPERILLLGRATLSRTVQLVVRHQAIPVEIAAGPGDWADPGHAVRRVHRLGPVVGSQGRPLRADQDWAQSWRRAGAAVHAALAPVIERSWPSGPALASTLLRHLPSGSTLFVGSSNPVRDVDVAMSAEAAPGLSVVANRGLAGIDGCVSTASGLALAAEPGSRTYALVGDLTFLHDSNALVFGPQEPRPDLSVVVLNDDGGGIFATLEPGQPDRAGDFERVFGTPTGVSIANLCRAYRVAHEHIDSARALAASIAHPTDGVRVLEVRVDRSQHRALREQLRQVASQALAAPGRVEDGSRARPGAS